MERLTERERNVDGTGVAKEEITDGLLKPFADKILTKLAVYEDLEEQGLLVRLPCKVGDMVWDNDFGYPESYEIKAFSYGYCDSYVEPDIEDEIIFYYENYTGSITGAFPMSEIGKTVFLTREEAVKKLEEMKK
jgi:hypothetical protein|nr:MAG TPA: hypothetical protein [Caudoviricetes sp.]